VVRIMTSLPVDIGTLLIRDVRYMWRIEDVDTAAVEDNAG